ncbi:BON domain-containing protein, partial [candidate division KSB1 bacterium]|nr:BON domain-containing protein [candidate division KSB1 bacterium]
MNLTKYGGKFMRVLTKGILEKAPTIQTVFISMLVLLVTGWLGGIVIAEDTEIKDKDITNAIESRFQNDDAVFANMIDVETKKGIVYLSGWVDNLLAK